MTHDYRKEAEKVVENWQHYDFSKPFMEHLAQALISADQRGFERAKEQVIDICEQNATVEGIHSKIADAIRKLKWRRKR